MNITQNDLEEGFSYLGLKSGDSVLVHSSLSSFGLVQGGAITVIDSFLNILKDEGLVIVPTLTGKATDCKDKPPIFDVKTTPCWTGKIPETFRMMKLSERSLHPTHSVAAIGERKHELIKQHETGLSPCDDKSPYYKNALLNGYIMLIGVDQECNTTIHCCEEIANVPYHLQKEETDIYITDYKGDKVLVRNRLHDWGHPTDFNRFDDLFLNHNIMKIGKIGNSTIRLLKAKDMLEFAVDRLIKEPLFLLDLKA